MDFGRKFIAQGLSRTNFGTGNPNQFPRVRCRGLQAFKRCQPNSVGIVCCIFSPNRSQNNIDKGTCNHPGKGTCVLLFSHRRRPQLPHFQPVSCEFNYPVSRKRDNEKTKHSEQKGAGGAGEPWNYPFSIQ